MKQSRRRELKTNELSVLLQQAYGKLTEYGNYLIVGLVAVVLVLIVAFVVRYNRLAAEQMAWQVYYEIREGDVIEQPELLDRAATLAAQRAGDRVLEPLALELQADLAYHLAVGPESTLPRNEKVRHLASAEALYEQILARFAHTAATADRLRMSLAATRESLLSLDPARTDQDAIRALYEAVLEGEPTAFQSLARQRLDTLADRTQPLQIVATRPAEPPPADAVEAPDETPAAEQAADEPSVDEGLDESPATAPPADTAAAPG